MGIIFVNKVLFLHTAFPVLSLTAAHLGVSALFTRLALALGIFKAREAKMDWVIFLVASLQGLAISLGQASLKMNSMSFFQLTKQMQVPLVATIEYFWLGRKLSTQKIALLLAMTFGVCMSNVSDVQFTYLGAAMAIAGTLCTSGEVVLYSWLQQSKGWETLQLLYNTMPYCTVFMIIISVFNDVLPAGFFVNLMRVVLGGSGGGGEGGERNVVPPIEMEMFHINAMGIILFLSSCALGMCVNVSSCFVGGKASALAYAMLGLAKTITVIIVGIAFFDAPPTWKVMLGTFIAISAIVAYTAVSLAEKQRAAAAAAAGGGEPGSGGGASCSVENIRHPGGGSGGNGNGGGVGKMSRVGTGSGGGGGVSGGYGEDMGSSQLKTPLLHHQSNINSHR